jgi:hypothetical protein
MEPELSRQEMLDRVSNGGSHVDSLIVTSNKERLVLGDEESRKRLIHIERMRKHMSEPDKLKLPPLLERRRQEFLIPDGFFEFACMFDKILIYQPDENVKDKETYGDTKIVMPDTVRINEAHRCPAGIIVSAGAIALDHFRTNGVDLGHLVRFAMFSALRIEVDCIEGRWFHAIPMQSGDVIASADFEAARRGGEVEIVWSDEHGQHLVLVNGKPWTPTKPAGTEY